MHPALPETCSEASLPLAGLFVTGTGTGVGKTIVTAALLRALRLCDVAAQALKPVQTGVAALPDRMADDPEADMHAYCQAVADLPVRSNVPAGVTLHGLAMAASPHLAASREGHSLSVTELAADIRRHWRHVAGRAAMLLLEGAGGLHVPLNADEDMIDLMAELELPVLLVCDNRLGMLNHALLSLFALRERGLSPAGIVLDDVEGSEGAAAEIACDNAAMLVQRLAAMGCDAPVLRLPALTGLPYQGWQDAAMCLMPLARQLAHSVTTQPESGTNLVSRDHATLWHPYASAVLAPPLCATRRSHHNRLVLTSGEELVDGMSSWWAAIHGYNHPRLLDALRTQAARMPHVMFGGLTHEPAVALAERLLRVLPAGLRRIFFADSGSVAVEVAMKMALQYHQASGQTRRTRFLTPRGGYHGDTLGAMSVCDPVTGMHGLFAGLLPQQLFMERPATRFDQPFVPSSLDGAKRILQEHGEELAACILEPVVQGAGGMWFYHPQYLRELAALCREAGALLIFDEIATGFGRTGRYFAADWAGLTPDILCCGKALTGGVLTLAATACTAEVAQGICATGLPFMHGPTYMANALACAVACASLDILAENRWQAQLSALERALAEGLAPCQGLPGVHDVRVLGGIGVVEMDTPVNTRDLQDFFVRQGVWIRPFKRLIYLMPPYVSPVEDVTRLCHVVGMAVRQGIWR